ncbi:acetoacetyl-CoA synthase [Gemmatirosa kalamazoonensis]|uniref:Acetoacetyl-CoA synthase n=1 Tax=Gemmatirosa kalamazoonensis TaxID=861299 RepID=W0RB52_9BACT|nr:acetoacetate--CoA ligase [Gemmatirosa kalamazoonensis]AHG88021.1 acetoacetyl-CoA synthase [Gemmatirosa kalamazoonensis]
MTDGPVWSPSPARVARSNLAAFAERIGVGRTAGGVDYDALWRWSVDEPARFWAAIWDAGRVIADDRWDEVVVGVDRMAPPDPVLGPRWFTGARLNFAENLLRPGEARDGPAIVARTERGDRRELTWDELRARVAAARAALVAEGIGAGDRVAGFMPNVPETVIAMLAAASLGAVWSSCSPDFGVKGVLDRFSQIEPVVLVCAEGYQYAGKPVDSLGRVREIAAAIPSLRRVVVVGTRADIGVPSSVRWDDWVAPHAGAELAFARLPFDHPLYIMYSSGTTGLPKCMVHSAGGTLLQHLKEHTLHCDIGPADRVFYYTTCGWMMWNWLASVLATGAAIVLWDGAPMAPTPDALWTMAQEERLTVFGTSAKYLALCEKDGLAPHRTHDLSALRAILSTGSPLAPASFDWVYRDVKRDVHLASISGGTDIISCFVGGVPTRPVWRGEIQGPALAMRVDVYDERGRPAPVGAQGELVCTMPFPSMPVAFWNDPGGAKYRHAYFATWPNVWRHGDWIARTVHDGFVITGRSDATLNPGGVRVGTAEIYRQVEQLPEIVEALVVGQDVPDGGATDTRVVLFVRLRPGLALDDALRDRIRRRIRDGTSPHHVPKVIVQVADIPRTISGKITELAVRDVIHGRTVSNTDALANPEALALYRDLPELHL